MNFVHPLVLVESRSSPKHFIEERLSYMKRSEELQETANKTSLDMFQSLTVLAKQMHSKSSIYSKDIFLREQIKVINLCHHAYAEI